MPGVYLHSDGHVTSDEAQAWRAEQTALAQEFAPDAVERRYRETLWREYLRAEASLARIEDGVF